jgi:DNA-binding NtrC family response regulator
LAERKDDIPLLCHHFVKKYATLTGKPVKEISAEATELLASYDFPGNVRELENIIERGVALTKTEIIDVKQLPEDLRGLSFQTFRRKEGDMPSLTDQEQAYIQWVLTETRGNKSAAAQILGIDRVSLWRKLKKYDLEAD